MKKKFLSFILALFIILPCTVLFSACDLFGGDDEVDPNLYHIKLSYSTDVESIGSQDDLKIFYGFGEHGEGIREDYEIEELTAAGATQADLDKAFVRQGDGSYYFFAGDPVYIFAPNIPSFEFLGFYYKGTNKKTNYNLFYQEGYTFQGNENFPDGTPRPDYRYKLEEEEIELNKDQDIEIEARYEAKEYNIWYADSVTGNFVETSNPATYKVTNGSKPLEYDVSKDGYSLKWTTDLDGEEEITDLKDYDFSQIPETQSFVFIYANFIESPKPSFTVSISVVGLTADNYGITISYNGGFCSPSLDQPDSTEFDVDNVVDGTDFSVSYNLFGRYTLTSVMVNSEPVDPVDSSFTVNVSSATEIVITVAPVSKHTLTITPSGATGGTDEGILVGIEGVIPETTVSVTSPFNIYGDNQLTLNIDAVSNGYNIESIVVNSGENVISYPVGTYNLDLNFTSDVTVVIRVSLIET